MIQKHFLAVILFLLATPRASYANDPEIISAFITGQFTIEITLSNPLPSNKLVISIEGQKVGAIQVENLQPTKVLVKTGKAIDFTKKLILNIGDTELVVRPHWKAIDALYYFSGDLGISYTPEATKFKLWAPLASQVTLQLFEDGNKGEAYRKVELQRGEKGVWETTLSDDLYGKFYTYLVTNFGETKEVLDPYAWSMGITTTNDISVGRGAILNPSQIGPKLKFATIPGFQKREDAIIWEIHVRDFTVDPDLNTKARFGTYKAFSEKVDYIAALGVTHVQLLPVLSYARGDESINHIREWEYKIGANYNWGYDPHNYFSPEGMYSENPSDPALRIKELKELIQALHAEELGVTLDVVYNHTASLGILEDIVPGYYHFMDRYGNPKESYGGGRLGTTHAMARKLIVDSIVYWTREYKVDGFRFDLMGDLDGETVQQAFDEARKINPQLIMVGEGWRTYAGDDGETAVPADQDWMGHTESAASFSDEMRNEIKSGFGSEGQPRFITGGARDIQTIFNNIVAKPGNMTEDDPGDVLQYLAAHDNLTLHDVIAHSTGLDPSHKNEEREIQKRIRLGNAIILTSQGIPFLHAGQEYGRTKVWKATQPPQNDFTYVEGFEHPYFIHNSYDASDRVNFFDWDKVTTPGIHRQTMEYTRGLIELRKSTDAFRLATEAQVAQSVRLIRSPEIKPVDLVIGFSAESTRGDTYYVFINADDKTRTLSLNIDLTGGTVVVDDDEATSNGVSSISGVEITSQSITVSSLTVVVIKK